MVNLNEYIEKIDDHAYKNYEQWDHWVECLDPVNKVEILEGSKTFEQALRKAAEWVGTTLEIQADRADACALYDTGEQSQTDYYNEIQANAKLSVNDLIK